MTIHREGTIIIIILLIGLIILNLLIGFMSSEKNLTVSISAFLSIFPLVFVINFFRNPVRLIENPSSTSITSPADGTIVAIEEFDEPEYFKEKKLKVSIFMSIWNVHCNRIPINGTVIYKKYHRGKFFIARKPKASLDNERTTFVIETPGQQKILVRQIAGILARRIISYPLPGQKVIQGEELGFIRFGSRVDLYLPLDTKIAVRTGDQVKGNITVIGTLKN